MHHGDRVSTVLLVLLVWVVSAWPVALTVGAVTTRSQR